MINKDLLSRKVFNDVNIEICNETRRLSEIATRKRPKIELLQAISNSIQLLFNHLYSVTEQLIIINNSLNKKLSISETTYLKFLNEYMADAYLLYKKNRYFASKYALIKSATAEYKELEAQYMTLNLTGAINGYTKLDLTFDDYKYFIKNFYEKEDENYYKKEFNSCNHKEQILNLNGGPKFIKKKVKADTLDTLNLNDSTKKPLVETKEKKETLPKTEIIIDNDIDRESLKDKNGYINCSVLPGVSIDNFPFSERFEIIEDLDLLPEEVNNVDFKFGKVNFDTSVIEEEFVYFYHRIFIHAIDPKSYGLKDGLLIITDAGREPEYHTGYLFFRYYKGKFYLIEHYRPVNITPQHTRQLINWRNNNQDDDLNKLYKDYLKIYPKGGHK